eukprot:GFKZ01000175.1.p1 GENE.GFKZ01000175.1~~GFKZ01000175.1.p1  ORF type:complete len:127 (+),score=1.11 GFKZ01000175.1:250-630(+)
MRLNYGRHRAWRDLAVGMRFSSLPHSEGTYGFVGVGWLPVKAVVLRRGLISRGVVGGYDPGGLALVGLIFGVGVGWGLTVNKGGGVHASFKRLSGVSRNRALNGECTCLLREEGLGTFGRGLCGAG